jgi:hypothetical protein
MELLATIVTIVAVAALLLQAGTGSQGCDSGAVSNKLSERCPPRMSKPEAPSGI